MSSIVKFAEFRRAPASPILLLVDLHGGAVPAPPEAIAPVLENCRRLLAAARRQRMPVAFVRQIQAERGWRTGPYPSWFPDLAPTRADMVFDRNAPSCYGSPEFCDMADHSPGMFAIAGLCSELSCVSTVVEGYHRGHRFTYIEDASASRGLNGTGSADMHRAVTTVLGAYADVTFTSQWLKRGAALGAVP